MVAVYFVYGLAFFCMGLAIFIYPRKGSTLVFADDLWLLSAFGFSHGLNEWVDMCLLVVGAPVRLWLDIASTVLLPLSYVFLIGFGARGLARHRYGKVLGPWVGLGLVTLWAGLAAGCGGDPVLPGIWARYLLGFPGIMSVAVVLLMQARALSGGRYAGSVKYLRLAAAGLACYGVFSGLIVPAGPFFPATRINYPWFLSLTGVPVQVFRSLCAVVFTFGVLGLLRVFDTERRLVLEETAETLRELALNMERMREEERAYVSREIHDGLGQLLTSLTLDLRWLLKHLHDGARIEEKLQSLLGVADSALDVARRTATFLRPAVLDDMGLSAGVEWLVGEFQKRSGCSCDLRMDIRDGSLSAETATGVFRILQESLTNVMRHAKARRVWVRLEQEGGRIRVTLRDDGCGLPDALGGRGFRSLGLVGMRERVRALGGSLDIHGPAGEGTTIEFVLPIKSQSVAALPADGGCSDSRQPARKDAEVGR